MTDETRRKLLGREPPPDEIEEEFIGLTIKRAITASVWTVTITSTDNSIDITSSGRVKSRAMARGAVISFISYALGRMFGEWERRQGGPVG